MHTTVDLVVCVSVCLLVGPLSASAMELLLSYSLAEKFDLFSLLPFSLFSPSYRSRFLYFGLKVLLFAAVHSLLPLFGREE